MKREMLDALLLLAGIKQQGVYEIANRYWPDNEYYAEVRRQHPWWLVITDVGPLVIGWRKRVISINWEDTQLRAKLTGNDNVTSCETYCHAWTYARAVEYLSAFQRESRTLPKPDLRAIS